MPWNFFLVNINLHVAWQEDFLLERIVKRHHYFSAVGKRGSYGGTQLSWQKQKHHGKTKNLTAKTKYLTAKPKTSWQKQNTSRQNEILHSKSKIALVLTWGIWFLLWSISCWFCREVFSFAVRILVLPWGFWFCCEVFGFAVRYFGFVVRFLVLPWQLWATVGSSSVKNGRWRGKD